ncbi:MAG: Glutamyl-tRNA(Gln) amidotransferase subunit A [Phycisphaerales bacterium]|nr:Glutamyl-tRNA(Gln) amidotransferase subunit A [Phycisphaerales bacterium]
MTSTLADIASSVREGRTSAAQLAREALDRAQSLQPRLNACLQIFDSHALEHAAAVDRRIAAGEGHKLPLAGVPVALKDNICLSWGRTTCASRILQDYASPFTATAAQRLIDAGAVVIAKTNLDEFAMGSSTENSAFGPTRNPWDDSRVPGGSSGGSAASVAARIVPVALGSDTGGSIRQPAALCGVVGLKPTYGRVSRYGLVAYASSLDQIGPFATCVRDVALALDVIAGHDPLDSTSTPAAHTAATAEIENPVAPLVIGVPRQARSSANHPAVAQALDNAAALYARLGATLVEVDLPMTDYGIAAYYIVALAEASSNLARFDGVRFGTRAALKPGESLIDLYCRSRADGLGPEVKRRILIGTHALSSGYYDAYYLTALKARRRIKQDFDRAFTDQGCHAILMPAMPEPAFRIGEKTDPLSLYLEDVYTVGVNLAGLPALSFPAGFAENPRLPIGLQLVGPAWSEATLLRVARMFERETDFAAQTPPL